MAASCPRLPGPRSFIALKLPPSGGDTLFGDCVKAYRSLSMGMKMLLSDLSAIHLAHGIVDPANFNASSYVERASSAEQVSHPVVGVHPTTHKKYLYVNQSFTKRFVGMTLEESAGLLTIWYSRFRSLKWFIVINGKRVTSFCGTIVPPNIAHLTITMGIGASCIVQWCLTRQTPIE